jgi:hypothetical protein
MNFGPFSKAIAIGGMLLSANVFAISDIRIRFPRGRTSTTVTGRINAGGRVCYFAGARRGQHMTATISSRSGKVQIFESGDTSYSYEIDTPGNQSICVDNLAGATSYTMTVSIQ